MFRKILQIFIITFFVILSVNSQTSENEKERLERIEKAKLIIESAQKAVYQNQKRENIKSIQVTTNGTAATRGSSTFGGMPVEINRTETTEENISIEFNERMNYVHFTRDANNPIENFTKVEKIVNGEKFSNNNDIVRQGKRFDMNSQVTNSVITITTSPGGGKNDEKKETKVTPGKLKPTKESLQKDIFAKLFPIFLDINWITDKTFVYIGKATAGDGRADILEIETDTGRQTRYFFDEKTHLLLMITDEISRADISSKTSNISSKTTTYFGDYQLLDGLMVAKKVNIESESSAENIEAKMNGNDMKFSSKSKRTSETIIKEFKINPTFKPDTFVVKESQ